MPDPETLPEWLAQERAAGAERARSARARVSGVDTVEAQYRLIARLLAEPPLDPLPAGFAARTARQARQELVAGSRLGILVERSLWAVLALSGTVALGAYQDSLARAAGAIAELHDGGGLWVGATAGCALVTYLIQRLARLLPRPR